MRQQEIDHLVRQLKKAGKTTEQIHAELSKPKYKFSETDLADTMIDALGLKGAEAQKLQPIKRRSDFSTLDRGNKVKEAVKSIKDGKAVDEVCDELLS